MLSERVLSTAIKAMAKKQLALSPPSETHLPPAEPGRPYMLYMHIPFCQVLCPYCSFNRYPFREKVAIPYFANLRKEMLMLKDLGYDFEGLYIGGGTPTIMIDELCETIDLANENFTIKEVTAETNPNHLKADYIEKLKDRVQRLSVGVQSFDNDLLKQMDRYEKYGSGEEILERIAEASPHFDTLNVDMIFNFPSQTEEILRSDLEKLIASGGTQATPSPLYASNATRRKMATTLGKMDYNREYRFYQILDETLAGGNDPEFYRKSVWTYNRVNRDNAEMNNPVLIDEYAEYPGIGSGAVTHLHGKLYVNTFSLDEYNAAIEKGHMPIMGETTLGQTELMRYRFLNQLYGLRLDKKLFEHTFGRSVERGLPLEMTFMRAHRAFEIDNDEELILTPIGRYLTLVMYRQFLASLNNLREQARAVLSGEESELLFEQKD
ncbi:MAG: coproporphyrinogen III oxidase family protein [Coriobacteriia bacterium]|nr:coproporphyrinogen III oxidase family protein [Coriobacteriia bacterium]MCL2871214.1 coproporphyrinogen III oxidase family protein [Coriobacteriia bacterium]